MYQEPKQPQLNGAYYGPSIPPPPKTYHRPVRDPASCCCGCLFDCGCCLLSCVFKIILKIIFTVVIIVGLIVLLFWLILRPHEPKIYTSDASLAKFNISSTNSGSTTLNYDLSLNLTFKNPNKRIGIYYDYIEVRSFYDDQRFAFETLSRFYQGHKNTTDLSRVNLSGQNAVVLSSDQSSDFDGQKSDGVFDITVKVYLQVRLKYGLFKFGKFKPKVRCELQVPLSSSGKSFQSTRCNYFI